MSQDQVQVSVNPILTQVLIGYKNHLFGWSELFPRVPVLLPSGTIIRFDNSDWVEFDTRKEANSNTNHRFFTFSGDTYSCDKHRLIGDLPKDHVRDAANMGIPYRLEERAATGTYNSILFKREIAAATIATTASNYDSSHKITLAGNDQWSHNGSDIIGQVNTGRSVVQLDTGMFPNMGVFGYDAFIAAYNNAQIVERYSQNTKPDELNGIEAQAQVLAAVLGLDRIIVAQALKKDAQTNTVTRIGGSDSVVLAYVPDEGDIYTPSYGYTYGLEGYPLVEEMYEDRDKDSYCYPVKDEFVVALTGPGGGYLISDCVA